MHDQQLEEELVLLNLKYIILEYIYNCNEQYARDAYIVCNRVLRILWQNLDARVCDQRIELYNIIHNISTRVLVSTCLHACCRLSRRGARSAVHCMQPGPAGGSTRNLHNLGRTWKYSSLYKYNYCILST